MTVRRRQVFLTLAFLVFTLAWMGLPAHAQGPVTRPIQNNFGGQHQQFLAIPQHEVWGKSLNPDQLKAALARLGQKAEEPALGPLEDLLKDPVFKQKFGVDPNDPQVRQALDELARNAKLLEKLQAKAKELAADPKGAGNLTNEEIIKQLQSQIPNDTNGPIGPPNGPPKDQAPNGQRVGPPNLKSAKLPFEINPATLPKQGQQPNRLELLPRGNGKLAPREQVDPPRAIDPLNPLPPVPGDSPFGLPDQPTDPRAKSLSALAALWEHNIGPLEETPELKRALFDLMSGENGFDFDIKDEQGKSMWDALRDGARDNSSLANSLSGLDGNGGDWKLPEFDLPTIGWGKWFGDSPPPVPKGGSGSSSLNPRVPSSSLSGNGLGGFSGAGGARLMWVVLGVAIVGGLIVMWWLSRNSKAQRDKLQRDLGEWPVDPRNIVTREELVKAFEYLSVWICGPKAKMWTHSTIGEALTQLAATHGQTAMKLARLYELARYAPREEPLTRHEVIEARHIICELGGIS
jgi:hypothetical protein